MSATSKLTLLMELKNKLFNKKLVQTQRKFTRVKDKMMGGVKKLKISFISAFTAMRNEIPLFGRAMDLLGNPYVLVIAGIVALTAVMGKGFVEAKKFNHEFLQIKQLNLDKSASQLDSYKENIRDAAFEVGTSLQDSTKAFYDLQSATGIYGRDAVDIFKKVGRYSIATGAQLGDSMNATTKAMKAFGLGVQDIDAFLISNAKTVQVGITTFDELAKVQTEYAGAASGAGQSVDTANKIFAAFTSIAKNSATAATMTKSAFEGLTQTNTVKGLKSIGISLYDVDGNMRNLGDVLTEVSGKFKKMTPQQIDTLIAKIGGPEGLRNLFIKLKTGADDFHKTLTAFDASQYDLNTAFKNAQGDVTVMASMVKNRFNTAMSKLGEVILPMVWHGLNAINTIIKGAYEGYDNFVKFLKGGSVWASVFKGALYGWLGVMVLVYGKIVLITAWMGIVKAATVLWTGAQWLLNAAMSANPIGLIIVVIGMLVGAIVWVVKKTEGWGKSWQALKKTASIVWQQMKLDFFFFVDSFKYGVEKLWLKFQNIGQHIVGFAQKVKEAVKLAWQGNFSAAKDKMKEEIVTEADKQLEELERKRKSQVNSFREQKFQNIKDIEKASKGISIKWKKSTNSETSEERGGLSGALDTGETSKGTAANGGGSLGQTAGSQIGNVQGKASGPRSISIHIDAINKGGINTSNTTLASMNAEEIEEWFTETIMRTIRGIELSHG